MTFAKVPLIYIARQTVCNKSTPLSFIQIIFALLILFIFAGPTPVLAQSSGITSPATGASATGAIPVFGTAVIDPFQKYELHYKLEPSGDDAYIYFDGDTTQITSGQLGVLQAEAFAPGTYSLRLRVVKLDGNYAEYFAQNLQINQVPTPTSSPTTAPVAAATATATRVTVGSVGAVTVTPTFTPPSLAPTETPIPTQTFTPAPQPTPAVGQVTQPQIQTNAVPTRAPLPTSTPVQVAAVVNDSQGDSGLSSADSASSGGSVESVINANADSSIESASSSEVSSVAQVASGTQSTSGSGASSSITRQLGETLAWNRLQTYFFNGMRYSATLFLVILLMFVGKRLLRWVRSQA